MKKLICLLVLLVAGISIDIHRSSAPAEPCVTPEPDLRPPEPIRPPTPKVPEVVVKASCACGCPCEDGCACGNGKLCSLNCICADYATMRAQAIRESKPLVVLVGGAKIAADIHGMFGTYCPSCCKEASAACVAKSVHDNFLVCHVTTFPETNGKCIVVSVVRDGELWWAKTLPDGATVSKVNEARFALPPAAATWPKQTAPTVCVGGK